MVNRLKIVIHGEVPPDYFRFTHPETGHKTTSADENSWLKEIKSYRENNGFPPIDPADAYDQLCRVLPPGWCRYENGEKPKWFVDTRLNVWDVLRGTAALIQIGIESLKAMLGISKFPIVSKELATSRSDTCAKCFFNVPISGCQPCVGLSDLIGTIGGSIKTPSDATLKTCAVCKCSTLAKTRLPIELIAKSTTPEQMERYPDFCWQKQEMAGIDSTPIV